MSKSDKLYNKSPTIKRDSDGKPGVQKPTKADATSAGLAGKTGVDGTDGEMPVEAKQTSDMEQMHDRHMQEVKDMHKRHISDMEHLKSKEVPMDEDGANLETPDDISNSGKTE